MSANSAAILGSWGGNGGNAFDDGWNNDGVVKLTTYYSNILNGLEVVYGNGTTRLHGQAVGSRAQVDLGSSAALDISVTVGTNSVFSGDPNRQGVLALGLAASPAPNSLPSGINGTAVHRPRVLGFFGRAGDRVDRLGFYLSA